jgi:hypothetical protein
LLGVTYSFFAAAAGSVSTPIMERDSSQATDAGREVGLRGRLEQFALATVLTLVDLERRSGQLLLLTSGGVGRLWLQNGRVVRARIEGSRRVRKAAVYELLGWNAGRFAFTQGDVSHVEDEIGASTAMLLIEAARRTDEQQNEAQASAP